MIRIDNINVQGLGPLKEFNEAMGDLNLIYGKNEKGKTFMVEFLIRSLFKNKKEFNLRPSVINGKVIVSGLDSDQEIFSPKSPRKLEDYLLKDYPGMPTNISKLLVVKGAELSLDQNEHNGVSKSVIKSFLTSESTLDQMLEKIKPVIRNAKIEGNEILGNNQGEIKKRNNSIKKLKELDRLHSELNEVLSEGHLAEIKHRKTQLEEQISEQKKAKRYLAYKLHRKKQEIKNKISNLDEFELSKLRENFDRWSRQKIEIEETRNKYEQANQESEHYPWLETALVDYQNLIAKGRAIPKRLKLIISGVLIGFGLLLGTVGGLVSIFADSVFGFGISTIGMFFLIIGVVIGGLYLRESQQTNETYGESEEIKRISQTFEDKFGVTLNDIATLREYEKKYGETYSRAKTYKTSLDEGNQKISNLVFEIKSGMQKFNISTDNSDLYGEKIQSLEKQLKAWKKQLQEAQVSFASLDISEDDVSVDDPGSEFDKSKLKLLEDELVDTKNAFRTLENEFELLKTKVQSKLNKEVSTDWDEILDNLRNERCEAAEEYRSLTSSILAGILVNQIIEEVRAKEDEKIIEQLKSPAIREPLSKITTHYEYLNFKDETILVGDTYNEFEIGELSTGAKEQVLLAIRLGFTSNLIGGKSAFFILDDAFQYADWTRREKLVDYVVDMTKDGWQMIYFTMDDHIRGLFAEKGKNKFGDQYKDFVLE